MPTAALTRSVWDVDADDFPSTGDIDEQAEFLLRYAILAPSSHNSQPWHFRVAGNEIDVGVEESRWLEAADPEKRELFISVGCAIENLCIAAEHFGFDPRVTALEPTDAGSVATVRLLEDSQPSNPRPEALFDAITSKRTNHERFEDRQVEEKIRERFRSLVFEDDVSLTLVEDPETRAAIGELQAEADRLLMDDSEYRRELGHWIGLGALGNSWLMARIGQAVVTHLDVGDREAKKNSALVDSAPVVGVLRTDTDDSPAQVRTGQVFERLALGADTAGLAVHPMSQTLERQELRARLRDLLPDDEGIPQHLFRLGYADDEPSHTPRWPLETFLPEA